MEAMHKLQQENIQKQLMAQQILLQQQVGPLQLASTDSLVCSAVNILLCMDIYLHAHTADYSCKLEQSPTDVTPHLQLHISICLECVV